MAEVSLYMTPHAKVPVVQEARVLPALSDESRHALKATIYAELLKRVDLATLSLMQGDTLNGRSRMLAVILQLTGEQSVPLSAFDRDLLANEVLDDMFGLGPLEPLLQDPTVSDILVNTASSVYVERRGVIEKTQVVFKDNAHLMHVIDKIVSAVGRRIDESSPMVDARLLDGSRVNIVIPPLAVDGPLLSIRRFGSKPLSAEDLVRNRTLTRPMLGLLRAVVQSRLNIIVSGGTGAGKTTLLNVLSGFISSAERIVTIEDSAELQIKQEHVVRLECRPANLEGKGAIRQRELVVNALRMRPDRIIIGEVRSEEALDMLQAMNTGHEGSITTVHANTPRDAIARIETMAMMGTLALSEKAVRAQIVSAIDVVVQISRMNDGARRITHISEVTGTTAEVISMQDIFLFERQGVGSDGRVMGHFKSTGIVPGFAERLHAAGIVWDAESLEGAV